jgi:hypothetical protein
MHKLKITKHFSYLNALYEVSGIRIKNLLIMPRLFSHHFLELILRLLDPFSIIAVHHKDEALCVLEVMAPQWSETEK